MPSELGVPMAVAALLLATVILAALAGRYQVHSRRLRGSVRYLESSAASIVESLGELSQVPLCRELRIALRGEVLSSYQRIRRLRWRYPEIAARMQQAEQALQAEAERSGASIGPIDNEAVFRRIVSALENLIEIVERGGFAQPIPHDVRIIFRRELGERRAEVMAKYHFVQSKRHAASGDTARARCHLTELLQVLRQQVPNTDFVRALYAEAKTALDALSGRQLGQKIDRKDASAA